MVVVSCPLYEDNGWLLLLPVFPMFLIVCSLPVVLVFVFYFLFFFFVLFFLSI